MEQKRCQAIGNLISMLKTWLQKFQGSSHECPRGSKYNFACSSMLLGALTKEMNRIGLLGCWLREPFQHLSFDDLYNNIHTMESPPWTEPKNDGYYGNLHPCGFKNTVKNDADRIKAELTGLNLEDFKVRG